MHFPCLSQRNRARIITPYFLFNFFLLFLSILLTTELLLQFTMASAVTAATVSPRNALDFFTTLGRLKVMKRTGWVREGVALPESIADHMYRMSMLTMVITDPAINKDRTLKICLVHDLAESMTYPILIMT
jgi:HD domain